MASFVEAGSMSRDALREALAGTEHGGNAGFADPCLAGQLRNIPASVYEVLARKYPDKFQQLDAQARPAGSTGSSAGAKDRGVVSAYPYVALDVAVPRDFLLFSPEAITNGGRAYGGAWALAGEAIVSHVAYFHEGNLTILQEGIVNTVNESGTAGGFVVTDLETFTGQAALFTGEDLHLIPPLLGETLGQVLKINDLGIALVSSEGENGQVIYLYDGQEATPLVFPMEFRGVRNLDINNQNVISGTASIGDVDRGFRYDPRGGLLSVLEPQPGERHSWATDINNHGDILGYSFIHGGIERIGVWDAEGTFHTYFVEGTTPFPTVSNRLEFNDNNLIAISVVTSPPAESGNAYLVPKPGVRLNLADLITEGPADLGFLSLTDINN